MEMEDQLKAQETARSLAYRMFADAFRLPAPGLPEVLRQLASALASLGSDAREDAFRMVDSGAAEPPFSELQVEYTRLFLGPFLAPAPPFGSVYLEKARILMGYSTQDALDHYRSMGMDLSPDFREAPDHVCAELEFMQVLIRQGLGAIEAADEAMLLDSIRRQRGFLTAHIGAWLPAFADKVIEFTHANYYRRLASAARTFITEEIALLPDPAELEAACGSDPG
ncbi:molecular chaperone [Desulfococcus sp.]|uniref:TorD/DmsD family molecular chaperone n=1 Tax=Desulfococcus sp. TaxID=2025834 RepID=UPI0035948452